MAVLFERWPARFFVPSAKIVDYLLDPKHDDGGSKCVYLTSYGFDRAVPQLLDQALVLHACPTNLVRIVPGSDRVKYVFDGPLPAPNGRDAYLLTVWQMDRTTGADARFITARPSR